MSLHPKKNSFDEAPQHARPSVRIRERPVGALLSLWLRLLGWFRRRSATSSWLTSISAEHWTPMLEPSSSFPSSEDFPFLDDSYEILAKITANNFGTLSLFSCLDVAFDNRPFDVPFYTARKGRALIALTFSDKILPGAFTLERVVSGYQSMTLHLTSFVEREIPILRASLMFPDNLRAPLVIEALLNLCDEDVQEFLHAVMSSEELDFLLRHEMAPDTTIDLAVSAPMLAGLVHSQLAALADAWSPDLSPVELLTSRQTVARVYRSSQHARDGHRGVKLRRVGRAKCLLR